MKHHSTIEYELRDCPHCDGQISEFDRNGKRLEKAKYDKRTACGNCHGKAIAEGKRAKKCAAGYVAPDIAERFCRGL